MDNLKDLRQRNQKNINQILDNLSTAEQTIWARVVSFELENRHMHQPTFRQPIREIVEQAITQHGASGTTQ